MRLRTRNWISSVESYCVLSVATKDLDCHQSHMVEKFSRNKNRKYNMVIPFK